MTNQQKGAEAGSRHHRTLGLGVGGAGLACLLLAAAPAYSAPEARSFSAPAASTAAVALTLNSASPAALSTVMPEAESCPQQAPTPPAPTAPATAVPQASTADAARCPPTLTGRLLGMAARKAGEFLSVPILVF